MSSRLEAAADGDAAVVPARKSEAGEQGTQTEQDVHDKGSQAEAAHESNLSGPQEPASEAAALQSRVAELEQQLESLKQELIQRTKELEQACARAEAAEGKAQELSVAADKVGMGPDMHWVTGTVGSVLPGSCCAELCCAKQDIPCQVLTPATKSL
jgi:TolA-binding protein